MVRVGIPRALYYYQYFPGWKAFFETLGAEIVVSPPTNKAIFAAGNARTVAETCLPVKLFCGHVISLANKCDCVFVPALRSLGGKAYFCSKFIGLPDMTRALVPESPPILDPEVDLNKRHRSLYQAIHELGFPFSANKSRIKQAVREAEKAHLVYRREMSVNRVTPIQALNETHGDEDISHAEPGMSLRLSIAVIGHPYVIYDDYVTHRLISRLREMGVRVFTPEMAEQGALEEAMTKLGSAPHWSFEADIVGAGEFYLRAKVDGIISVAVFGCGPDSMMIDVVRHRATGSRTPFLHLSLDEHTSEGGLLTRLEAFLDMVKRRRRVCA
ncbi:MAG: acyl-CoA dehydratase activase-related protein [Dehalococcoidia bacterium]